MAEGFLQKLNIQDDKIQSKKRVVNEIIEHGQARRYVTRITDGFDRRFRIVMVVRTILAAFQRTFNTSQDKTAKGGASFALDSPTDSSF